MDKQTKRTKSANTDSEAENHNQSQTFPKFERTLLKVDVEIIKDHHDPGVIGGSWTFIALKNPTSYLIATSWLGLKLYENGDHIYSDCFPGNWGELYDIIYIEHLNCYLLSFTDKLYRKDINPSAPYPFMNLCCRLRPGNCLRYSRINKRLITALEKRLIAVVNLYRKQVEMKIRTEKKISVKDFKVLGKKENMVVYLTDLGSLSLCSLNFGLRKICTKHTYQIDSTENRTVDGHSLAVCDQSRYILAQISAEGSFENARLSLFEVKGRFLEKLATFGEFWQRKSVKFPLEFSRRIGNHLLWVGLTSGDVIGSASIFDFSPETGELRELVEKSFNQGESNPKSLIRIGATIYYIGDQGKVMRLNLNN